jgi:hypothetical protein
MSTKLDPEELAYSGGDGAGSGLTPPPETKRI